MVNPPRIRRSMRACNAWYQDIPAVVIAYTPPGYCGYGINKPARGIVSPLRSVPGKSPAKGLATGSVRYVRFASSRVGRVDRYFRGIVLRSTPDGTCGSATLLLPTYEASRTNWPGNSRC